uniref:Uncharacterized protein n=1 Tax=Meloidogyne floridensis TaxID=298350 RepID=A0A915NN91_9BILA
MRVSHKLVSHQLVQLVDPMPMLAPFIFQGIKRALFPQYLIMGSKMQSLNFLKLRMPNSPSKITESTTSNQQQMPNKINFSSLNEENERITNSLSPPENNKNIILNNSTTSPPHLKEEDSSPPPHL